MQMKNSIIMALMALATVTHAGRAGEADHRVAFMVEQCESMSGYQR